MSYKQASSSLRKSNVIKQDPDESASQCDFPLNGQKEKKKNMRPWTKQGPQQEVKRQISEFYMEGEFSHKEQLQPALTCSLENSLFKLKNPERCLLHTEYIAPPIGHLKNKQEKKKEKKNYLAGH